MMIKDRIPKARPKAEISADGSFVRVVLDIDRALYEFAFELTKNRDGWTYLPEEEVESMIEMFITESIVPDEFQQRFPVGRKTEEVIPLSPEEAARLPANYEDGLPI
jgi:hypothetical protein